MRDFHHNQTDTPSASAHHGFPPYPWAQGPASGLAVIAHRSSPAAVPLADLFFAETAVRYTIPVSNCCGQQVNTDCEHPLCPCCKEPCEITMMDEPEDAR